MLQAEFEILGVDPDKVTAKAPQKSENAVFDLMAVLDDPDGEGGDPPVGITLSWTERLIGDYNQDGMVTSNDLTPIGQHWDARIDFDPPEQHGGIEYWPAGDPCGHHDNCPALGGTIDRLPHMAESTRR